MKLSILGNKMTLSWLTIAGLFSLNLEEVKRKINSLEREVTAFNLNRTKAEKDGKLRLVRSIDKIIRRRERKLCRLHAKLMYLQPAPPRR